MNDVAGVLAGFSKQARNDEERKYLETHSRRYEYLVDRLRAPRRLLDVGPSYESALIRALFPSAQVDTLGFHDDRFPLRDGETHTEFDLNDAADPRRWPALEPYDVIVCAEVIEHLYISPLHLLRMLRSLLAPDGSLLIQTPNAAAIERRFWLLAGRNPFEPLREDLHHAGHFREYTLDELVDLAARTGFSVLFAERRNYFLSGSRKNRLLVDAGFLMPSPLRHGITIELRPA
jgi:trans-aconitate methyltransferase